MKARKRAQRSMKGWVGALSAPEVGEKKKKLKHVFMLVVRAQLWLARGKGYAKSARPLSKYLQ